MRLTSYPAFYFYQTPFTYLDLFSNSFLPSFMGEWTNRFSVPPVFFLCWTFLRPRSTGGLFPQSRPGPPGNELNQIPEDVAALCSFRGFSFFFLAPGYELPFCPLLHPTNRFIFSVWARFIQQPSNTLPHALLFFPQRRAFFFPIPEIS